jgi:hypothetical protein
MGRREKQFDKMTTHHEYRGYVFTISYQPQDPAYTVDFPDFPEIITSGQTLGEAFRSCLRGIGSFTLKACTS